MKKLYIFVLTLTGLLFLLPETSHSIPAFARKHGFNCNMCHTSYTKLNDYGQRVRDNGYQLPGQEGFEKNVLETAPPIAIRTTTGLSVYNTKKGTTNGFNIFGLDFLAAGVLHKNISFMFIYTPRIDEPAADYKGPDNGTNPVQLGAVESANLIFSNIVKDALNVRIGRFEPAYHAFSSKRSFYIFEPYEIYAFATPSNCFVFDDNQIGLEATGHFRNGFKYGVGVVNGNGANPDNNQNKDFYLNLFQTFGKGDGQSAGQRIGAFGYYGWQPTTTPEDLLVAPTGEANCNCNKPFYRLGGDASLNWKTFNLQALFMQGVDDKAFNTVESEKDYTYTGGFAELDWAGLMNNRLIASVLYNWVQPPCRDDSRTINAYSALLRYYLGDWTAVNIALHAEYTHRETGKTDKLRENLFTLLVDFDF
jgi:hypothetical protein